jgi:hypothetical protein
LFPPLALFFLFENCFSLDRGGGTLFSDSFAFPPQLKPFGPTASKDLGLFRQSPSNLNLSFRAFQIRHSGNVPPCRQFAFLRLSMSFRVAVCPNVVCFRKSHSRLILGFDAFQILHF